MDPNTTVGTVISDVLAALITAGVLGVLAWFAGPLRWLVQNRALRQLLSNGRRFLFTFNPKTGQSKYITFLADGKIGEGQNQNEHAWRIRRGLLEIFAADGAIYSRFRHDKVTGHLKHTNDADLRSIHGQYLEPSLVRVAKPAEQAVAADDRRGT
jgi:hypothetical protein